MTKRTLPKYVSAYRDRHGRVRYRFRKEGGVQTHLPEIGAPEFEAVYRACLSASGVDQPARGTRFEPKPMKGTSYVYFIGAGRGPIKIGRSVDLAGRLSRLRVNHHQPLLLMAFVEGGEELERSYHERFSASRLSGEWFSRSKALLSEIGRLRILMMSNLSHWKPEVRHCGTASSRN